MFLSFISVTTKYSSNMVPKVALESLVESIADNINLLNKKVALNGSESPLENITLPVNKHHPDSNR